MHSVGLDCTLSDYIWTVWPNTARALIGYTGRRNSKIPISG